MVGAIAIVCMVREGGNFPHASGTQVKKNSSIHMLSEHI